MPAQRDYEVSVELILLEENTCFNQGV